MLNKIQMGLKYMKFNMHLDHKIEKGPVEVPKELKLDTPLFGHEN